MTEATKASEAVCSCAIHLVPILAEIEKLANKGGITTRLNKQQESCLTKCLVSEEGELRYHAKCITEHLGLSPKRIRRLKAKVPVAVTPAAQKTSAPVTWPLESDFTENDVQWLLDVNDKMFESLHHCISTGRAQDGLDFTKALVRNIVDLATYSEKPPDATASDAPTTS
ncbi:hypothetical protein SARC_08562 [Sphaeroforma arctica JP610]|uniref:Uncharacterized protein n=1 Tax=Sphaeroforma arctica JP610 TaxID=667725 RepID=A0A0L0FR66_9EUKA|nr:hypothetical protein SARC_08562 [Sphaeroforma arctica JP610]KNC79036.1 hypothetical protein SARC_08562 [Sphaeroforma arctica JP610]|eukprot:XP_014152938.1 hypothetical protein SARC_08562 [Sphaeroforma arctica JP610]